MSMCAFILPPRQCIAGKHNITAKGARIRAEVKEKRQDRERKNKDKNSTSEKKVPTELPEQKHIRRNPGNHNFRYTKTNGTRL